MKRLHVCYIFFISYLLTADIELDLLNDVVQCYGHLVSSLPDLLKYLQTCSGLVKVEMGTNTEGWSHDQLMFR